jgi:hypothetical protein
MLLHRIGSLAVTSLLAGAVSFAIGCGGSETISKSHDHSAHSHGDGDDDGAATAGELPRKKAQRDGSSSTASSNRKRRTR